MKKAILISAIITCFLSACTKECENGDGCDKIKIAVKNNKLQFKNTGVEIITIYIIRTYGDDGTGYSYSTEVAKEFTLSGGLSKSFSKSDLKMEEAFQFPELVNIVYKGSSCGTYGYNLGGGLPTINTESGTCALSRSN